jgi:Ni2+-binding GTPase involved in maturation of urease and hydrogenase
MEVINAINEVIRNKGAHQQAKIVIAAPTGCGKTEMFYLLAKQQKIRMILALAYTAQVFQGKEHHTVQDILSGLCEDDHFIPKGSLFLTYDKAKIVQKEIMPNNYIMSGIHLSKMLVWS